MTSSGVEVASWVTRLTHAGPRLSARFRPTFASTLSTADISVAASPH
ncbi:hypothetical protein [Gordonia aurantiaca]